ncbi:MAG: hypothetical protein R3331_00020 [Sulfurospirillaceae bacterium]|nr:hypothetical protein [Sulfurospirillaceae bacterium]
MNELLRIEYNPLGRIYMLLVWLLFGLPVGLFLFLVVNNYFANFFGILLVTFSVFCFLNLLCFKSLIFYENEIIKESSIFGKVYKRTLSYSKMETTVSKRLFGGSLMFWEKENKWKTYWFFVIDLFPVSNEDFKKIRQILIDKNIIDGDFHWNY